MKQKPKRGLTSLFVLLFFMLAQNSMAQGAWTALRDTAPELNAGVMLLLTDGSIIMTTTTDPNAVWDDSCGPAWNKLTPDSTGSYVNGKWSLIAPMHNSRLYFSSQVLQNGKVYVAGGEFGTGSNMAELYDPGADTWTPIPGIPSGNILADANSQMLPDGRVLQNSVYPPIPGYGMQNFIYNPDSNSFSSGPLCLYNDDEATWLKLADNSILFENFGSTQTERYIPSLNRWIQDADMPTSLYDIYGTETGAALLLPDGRAFFLGSNGNTAYYTPSGDTTNGSWNAGPMIPNGLGTPDAAAAMMPDGHILCTLAPVPNGTAVDSIFHPIMYFYDFDYATNTFANVGSPDGHASYNQPSCASMMLDLPDGTVLLGIEGCNQYYIYTPGNPPLAGGKPAINSVTETDCNFMITGTLFNGISQGAAFGDDWQMATNYPIVRLVSNGRTWFARTTHWNRTGVQTGSLPDTAYFTIPVSVPSGNYSLLLSANGISSDTFSFTYNKCPTEISSVSETPKQLQVIPNPAHQQTTLQFNANNEQFYTIRLTDICGRVLYNETGVAVTGPNHVYLPVSGLAGGIYLASIIMGNEVLSAKIVVQ
jgi:Secretion system C-terminal sorting domain/Kelch motif